MREINVSEIKQTISRLCIEANMYLPHGMKEKISSCIECEKSTLCKDVLSDIVRNIDCAADMQVPICQDTGMAVIFMDIGQDVHFTGGSLEQAINEGVCSRRPAFTQKHEQQHPRDYPY